MKRGRLVDLWTTPKRFKVSLLRYYGLLCYYDSMKRHTAYFGNTAIVRDKCPECKRTAFILDGEFACCGASASREKPIESIRIACSRGPTRKHPPIWVKVNVLATQRNRCLYCLRRFGSIVFVNGESRVLRLEWDHFLPFKYMLCSPPDNFVAACQLCNRTKRSNVFETIEEARSYVLEKSKAEDPL